jgi:hypothetical protein
VDGRCDSGRCVVGACRPGDPSADREGCVTSAVEEGEPCTDDGFACTEDVCSGGSCLHVPIDARCGPSDGCSGAVCAPDRRTRDPHGCAVGARPAEGGTCAEDGDPCSDDRCRDARCLHEPVPGADACAPVGGAFRRATGLGTLARSLRENVREALTADAGASTTTTDALDARLADVAGSLGAAVEALAGRDPALGAATADPAPFGETTAQRRARIAFAHVLRTPRDVRAFLAVLAAPGARAQLGEETGRGIRRRARVLFRGTRRLKAELRRLQQVSQTFAR